MYLRKVSKRKERSIRRRFHKMNRGAKELENLFSKLLPMIKIQFSLQFQQEIHRKRQETPADTEEQREPRDRRGVDHLGEMSDCAGEGGRGGWNSLRLSFLDTLVSFYPFFLQRQVEHTLAAKSTRGLGIHD